MDRRFDVGPFFCFVLGYQFKNIPDFIREELDIQIIIFFFKDRFDSSKDIFKDEAK